MPCHHIFVASRRRITAFHTLPPEWAGHLASHISPIAAPSRTVPASYPHCVRSMPNRPAPQPSRKSNHMTPTTSRHADAFPPFPNCRHAGHRYFQPFRITLQNLTSIVLRKSFDASSQKTYHEITFVPARQPKRTTQHHSATITPHRSGNDTEDGTSWHAIPDPHGRTLPICKAHSASSCFSAPGASGGHSSRDGSPIPRTAWA